MKNFDFQGALQEGYSQQEIDQYLSKNKINAQKGFSEVNQKLLKKNSDFDVLGALEEGYSSDEINEFLRENEPEQGFLEKAGRIGGQFALGAAESAALPYEIAAQSIASRPAQAVAYRQNVMEDIERLADKKQTGVWDQNDEELLENLIDQIKNPEKADQFVQTADIGIRGLTEKATGLDLEPEGILEKAANWSGFIKDPKKLIGTGLKAKDFVKAILPSKTEGLRGLGAGTGLQMAEDGEFGPIGTMAAMVFGDLAGLGAGKVGKAITNPKETFAKISAMFTPKDKLALQKEIIKDFRDSGLKADLGTITDSNLIKWTQSRLAQSGLTGKAFDEFKHELTGQIKEDYKGIADQLGSAKYSTSHEAGEALKEGMKNIRERDLSETRKLYENAEKELAKPGKKFDKPFVNSNRLASAIEKIEKQLKPGSIKSNEQSAVLTALDKLKKDLQDAEGRYLMANVKDLINNKIALNDIINYEVQGGAKQLLKGIVSELDRAIISYGKENPSFAKNYVNANRRFSEHARTFRNKSVSNMLNLSDPAQILNKMNTIQGIRDIDKIFAKMPEGKKVLEDVKRLKLDQIIGDNLVDSVSKQAKLVTFSKLLEKGKNRDIIREILGHQQFRRLEKLQKNAGVLADSVEKFFNPTRSGTVAVDAAIIGKGMSGIANLINGNPWPLIKILGALLGGNQLSKLLTDPKFLKLAEEAVLASEKGNIPELTKILEKLSPYILPLMNQQQSQ